MFRAALELVQATWKTDGPSSEMHVGDLCWSVFSKSPPDVDALRIWPEGTTDGDALTVYDGDGVCDLVVRPGARGLEAATCALDWVEASHDAGERSTAPLYVGRRVDRVAVRDLLKDRGYTELSAGFPTVHRMLTDVDRTPPVPDGYEVRQLRESDLPRRVRAFEEAFPADSLPLAAYESLRECEQYRPGLDLVVQAPDSDIVAFATLWLDPANRCVQIEPAGCRPQHRRLGLTRAAIHAGLRTSAELGATEAIVRASSRNAAAGALYRSCGFETASRHYGYVNTRRLP